MGKYEIKVKTSQDIENGTKWEDIPVLTTINRDPNEDVQDFENIVVQWATINHFAKNRDNSDIIEVRYNRYSLLQGHYIRL